MSRVISKIRINEKSVLIKYVSHNMTKEGDVRNTTRTVKSEVKPHPQFFDIFQKMKSYVIGYMELSTFKNKVDDSVLERFVVNHINIVEDTETTKIVVAMSKTLVNGKTFSFNSPSIDLIDDDFSELEDMKICLEDVLAEAESYLEGKNGEEQLELKFDSEAA